MPSSSMPQSDLASANTLLQALRPDDLAHLLPSFTEQKVTVGTVLYEPGDVVRYAYFPCGQTLVSFMVLLPEAKGVETALIGREGAVGGIVSQGRLPAYCRAVVQFSGSVLRLESTRLEAAKAESVNLRHMFARYADCLLAQVFQSVACNAVHSIEQRTARWLLSARDRTGEARVPLTQEQLASMLGVTRSYVSRVIGGLKRSGTLQTRRGGLSIRNLDNLKAVSCHCDDLVREHFDTLLKGVYPTDEDTGD